MTEVRGGEPVRTRYHWVSRCASPVNLLDTIVECLWRGMMLPAVSDCRHLVLGALYITAVSGEQST